MRSEQEMLDLITGVAKEDARIRAVIMNGSRTNPRAPRDIFQDYDIVYLVDDVTPFRCNLAWIERFGELMILQMPDAMGDAPPADGSFGYLMQFADGNRIDLTVFPTDRLDELGRDSLSLLLLDKDGVIEAYPPPTDSDYLPKPPTAKQFADCCNEFWWVSTYVAKGLWREEITYAKALQEQVVREQLMLMLTWEIGARTHFACSTGKLGKYFQQHLDPELWRLLLQTYADADPGHTWDALFVMGALFRRAALSVAEHFGYAYPHNDDARVSAHLAHVRALPQDAQTMY
ncbi:MAG: aminoglycoside 6-adenylyltransferase [Caldilineaceae bacterium]|nr:aminoglycoside 6-adenylyltransferase [Caldilineaceae bacterium]